MENKKKTTGKTEAAGETAKQNLNEQWGDNQVVLSQNQAKRILLAFKQEKLKGASCLIFEDKLFGKYRQVGQQFESQLLPRLEDKKKGAQK
jgi:hypothetical protein